MLEYIERLFVNIALEPILLSQEHPNREDHSHALVLVFVVVVLIRATVDALEMVRVPSSYDDIVGDALAVPLDPREVILRSRIISRRRLWCRSRCRRTDHIGALCQPAAEELVDGAAVFLVVVRQLARRAYEQDIVSPRLHGLAGVAIAAAAVLRFDHHLLVLLDVAPQFVRIILVFDRQLDVVRSVLVDLNKTVFSQSHYRLVDGDFDVAGSVEAPVVYALLPVEQLSSGL